MPDCSAGDCRGPLSDFWTVGNEACRAPQSINREFVQSLRQHDASAQNPNTPKARDLTSRNAQVGAKTKTQCWQYEQAPVPVLKALGPLYDELRDELRPPPSLAQSPAQFPGYSVRNPDPQRDALRPDPMCIQAKQSVSWLGKEVDGHVSSLGDPWTPGLLPSTWKEHTNSRGCRWAPEQNVCKSWRELEEECTWAEKIEKHAPWQRFGMHLCPPAKSNRKNAGSGQLSQREKTEESEGIENTLSELESALIKRSTQRIRDVATKVTGESSELKLPCLVASPQKHTMVRVKLHFKSPPTAHVMRAFGTNALDVEKAELDSVMQCVLAKVLQKHMVEPRDIILDTVNGSVVQCDIRAVNASANGIRICLQEQLNDECSPLCRLADPEGSKVQVLWPLERCIQALKAEIPQYPKLYTEGSGAWERIIDTIDDCVQLYDLVRAQLMQNEPSAVKELLSMSSLSLHRGALVADVELKKLGLEADSITQEPGLSLDEVLRRATAAHMKLKSKIAPGSAWSQRVMNNLNAIPQSDPLRLVHGDSWCILKNGFARDPGVKARGEIEGKASSLQRAWNASHLTCLELMDISRLDITYLTAQALLQGLAEIQKEFQVHWIENRFKNPSTLGYSDCSVGVEIEFGSQPYRHICELRLSLNAMVRSTEEEGQTQYDVFREVLATCGVAADHQVSVMKRIVESLGVTDGVAAKIAIRSMQCNALDANGIISVMCNNRSASEVQLLCCKQLERLTQDDVQAQVDLIRMGGCLAVRETLENHLDSSELQQVSDVLLCRVAHIHRLLQACFVALETGTFEEDEDFPRWANELGFDRDHPSLIEQWQQRSLLPMVVHPSRCQWEYLQWILHQQEQNEASKHARGHRLWIQDHDGKRLTYFRADADEKVEFLVHGTVWSCQQDSCIQQFLLMCDVQIVEELFDGAAAGVVEIHHRVTMQAPKAPGVYMLWVFHCLLYSITDAKALWETRAHFLQTFASEQDGEEAQSSGTFLEHQISYPKSFLGFLEIQ